MSSGDASDIVGSFRMGLDVLKRYPALVVPSLAAQAIVVILTVVFVGGAVAGVALGGGAGLMGALAGGFVFMLVGTLLSLVASGVTIVMARDALAGREPAIGDALGGVMSRLGYVIVASILWILIVGIGMMLLVLPGLAALFFLIFTLPAVLLDDRGAVDALKRSASLVRDNIGTVVGLIIGVILAGVAVMVVSAVLGNFALVGQLAAAVLSGLFLAYLTVVTVRVYQTLPRR